MWNMSSHEAKRPRHSSIRRLLVDSGFLCLGYKLSGISHMNFHVSGKNLHLLVSLGGSSAFVILMPKRSWPGAVAGVSAIFFSCRCWELADSRTKFYWVLDLVRPSLRLEHIRSLFFWSGECDRNRRLTLAWLYWNLGMVISVHFESFWWEAFLNTFRLDRCSLPFF